MTILAATVLALVAGLTEIFPVSGAGHLYLFARILGVSPGSAQFRAYRGALCLGVALALLLFYRAQAADMIRENLVLLGLLRPRGRRRAEPFGRRLGMLLLFGSLPMALCLLLNSLRLEAEEGSYSLLLISLLFCLSGLALYFAARGSRGKRGIHQMTLADSLWTGLAQVPSLFPGLSRAGVTMATLQARGLDSAAALEFSGLLGVPVFFLGGLSLLFSAGSGQGEVGPFWMLLFGAALSGVTAFLTLRFLTELCSRRKPTLFAYWSWAAGILALIVFLISA